MLSFTVPNVIRKVADRFKSISNVSYGTLCTLLHSAASGTESISDMARESPWSPSVSKISAELKQFDTHAVMRRMRNSLRKKLGKSLISERYCFAVDDTIVPRFGPSIFGIGNQRHHGKGGYSRGQRVMVLVLVDKERGVAYPLDFAMCFNIGAVGHVKGTDLCFNLVKKIILEGFPALFTVVDSWFDSVELLEKFDSNGLTLVVESKSNRLVRCTCSPKEPWKHWKEMLHKKTKVGVKLPKSLRAKRAKKTKYIASGRVRVKGRNKQVIACAVYNKPTDGDFFAVYISNNLDLTGADLWEHSRARWRIEETFRILKQSLSFLTLPISGEAGCYANICLPFLILNEVYLNPNGFGGTEIQSVGQILRRYSENQQTALIDELTNGTKRTALVILRARRTQSENQKKPVNPTADELSRYLKCA